MIAKLQNFLSDLYRYLLRHKGKLLLCFVAFLVAFVCGALFCDEIVPKVTFLYRRLFVRTVAERSVVAVVFAIVLRQLVLSLFVCLYSLSSLKSIFDVLTCAVNSLLLGVNVGYAFSLYGVIAVVLTVFFVAYCICDVLFVVSSGFFTVCYRNINDFPQCFVSLLPLSLTSLCAKTLVFVILRVITALI